MQLTKKKPDSNVMLLDDIFATLTQLNSHYFFV